MDRVILKSGYAGPRFFGDWVEIHKQINGPKSVKLDFSTNSSADSTFDIELDIASDFKIVKLVGACGYTLNTPDCSCITRARFRSHLMGQHIVIKVYN